MRPGGAASARGRTTRSNGGRQPSSAAAANVDDAGGELAECSCQACTAAAVADCVAICCCPCAVVGLLVAFLKLPWVVGRRRLRRRERRKVKAPEDRRKGVAEGPASAAGVDLERETEGGAAAAEGGENGRRSTSVKGEAEIWMELHQQGHLGFGRISTSGPASAEGSRGTRLPF